MQSLKQLQARPTLEKLFDKKIVKMESLAAVFE